MVELRGVEPLSNQIRLTLSTYLFSSIGFAAFIGLTTFMRYNSLFSSSLNNATDISAIITNYNEAVVL